MVFFQPQPQLTGIPIIALFADGLEVHLVKLGLDGHFLVARRAGKMINAPSLVEGGEDVALDDLVAHVAEISEELVIVRFAVRQALALVVTVAQERLLALGANKVLHVPVFAYSIGCMRSQEIKYVYWLN